MAMPFQPSLQKPGGLFNFGYDVVGITREEGLLSTINDQVKVFEHNRPNKGRIAIRFHNRVEYAAAVPVGQANAFCHGPFSGSAIGVWRPHVASDIEAQPLGDGGWNHQTCRTAVNHAEDPLPPDLLRLDDPGLSANQVRIVRQFHLYRKTTHAWLRRTDHKKPR